MTLDLSSIKPGPRDCQFFGYAAAPDTIDTAAAMVRTVYLSMLDKGNFDDKALAAAHLTLGVALERLEAVSAWVLDAYNVIVAAQWEDAERQGLIVLDQSDIEGSDGDE